MLRQGQRGRYAWAITSACVLLLGAIGLSAAGGTTERSPECAQLARLVAAREQSMLDSRRFRETERQAYGVCARDPAAFRKLIRIS